MNISSKPLFQPCQALALIALFFFSSCTNAQTTSQPTAVLPLVTPSAAEASGYPALPGLAEPAPTAEATEGYPAPTAPTEAAPSLAAIGDLAEPPTPYDAQRAYRDVEKQMEFGPRTPGSQAHEQVVQYIQTELESAGWTVEIQETTRLNHPVRNIIARRGSGSPWTILGAHFDSRMKADRDVDPEKQDQPVPGANDGASGVAVLLELARVLPEDLHGQVWLAFFDTEDQGSLPGWDWILGSRAVADSLTGIPASVIVVDMIGDANQNIFQEANSDPGLTGEIWGVAAQLGYADRFIPQEKFSMIDDHTPFLEKGIRAIDIIDFDYPYWHTTEDLVDKVSTESLQAVGDTLLHWILKTHAR